MTTTISPVDLAAALSLRDLSDPAQGPHAMQLLLDEIVTSLATRWGATVDLQRRGALVSVEDNYDRLGYSGADVTRDARYTRYAAETVMLRSHTSACVPPALHALASAERSVLTDAGTSAPSGAGTSDRLLVLPGLVYRRDVIDRLHVGTPHQLDLWRITNAHMTKDDLLDLVATLVAAALPGARWQATSAVHPYTVDGLQIDVEAPSGWVELAECGLAAPHVLAGAGLDPGCWSGLALGLGLDRAVMLRKGLDDIRLLRSSDPRVAAQLLDLEPWRPVSRQPPVRRDLSIVIDGEPDEELLGDVVREALGARVDDLESLAVLSWTPYESLPPHVQDRLAMAPGQANVLLRLVLRPVGRTLTDEEANVLRNQVYAAVHQGPVNEWAGNDGSTGQGIQDPRPDKKEHRNAPRSSANRSAQTEPDQLRKPSACMRSSCRAVIRAIRLPTPLNPPVPSTSSIISESRSASTCWVCEIASPTRRRAHSAIRSAAAGCSATAARNSRAANSARSPSASTSWISVRVGSSTSSATSR